MRYGNGKLKRASMAMIFKPLCQTVNAHASSTARLSPVRFYADTSEIMCVEQNAFACWCWITRALLLHNVNRSITRLAALPSDYINSNIKLRQYDSMCTYMEYALRHRLTLVKTASGFQQLMMMVQIWLMRSTSISIFNFSFRGFNSRLYAVF